jgi:branched-chain amino acid transport system ATP-binding protein
MAELARAVVDRPRVLLLDEPTSGLEHHEAAAMGDIIQRVRRDEGCAVVLIEHDVSFVMSQCDQVVALQLGTVLAAGAPDDVRNDPAVIGAYFGNRPQ